MVEFGIIWSIPRALTKIECAVSDCPSDATVGYVTGEIKCCRVKVRCSVLIKIQFFEFNIT